MKQLLLALALAVVGMSSTAYAESCYLCGSGSSNGCQQCRMGGKDTGEARKACEAKGCKISGTGSCSTAANVKVCKLETPPDAQPTIAWCAPR